MRRVNEVRNAALFMAPILVLSAAFGAAPKDSGAAARFPVSLGLAPFFRPALLPTFGLPRLPDPKGPAHSGLRAFAGASVRPEQSPLPAVPGQSSSPSKGSPKHIFWVIPAYNVEYLKNVPPLTPAEKFHEVAEAAYDPQGLALSAAEALLEHGRDGFCGYGHGWGGYGKCYGAALVDANVSGIIGDYALPVLFRQDPRFFRLGEGSFPTRVLYALSRVFICRTDSGRPVFDSSQLLGTVIAGGLSNFYYPRADRGFGLTLSRIGYDLGGTAVFNLEAEFWPDIHGWLQRHL